MYDRNLYKRDVTCSGPPSPCHKPSHLLGPLPPRAWRTLWTAPRFLHYSQMVTDFFRWKSWRELFAPHLTPVQSFIHSFVQRTYRIVSRGSWLFCAAATVSLSLAIHWIAPVAKVSAQTYQLIWILASAWWIVWVAWANVKWTWQAWSGYC